MDGVEVPQFFVCPISLQIMKDPVTAATGITYDRESIERWLLVDRNPTCPVSNQPLPPDSDLTPNHTLRRLIQGWCCANPASGIDRIPTPRAPVTAAGVGKLLADLAVPQQQREALQLMASLASDSESNRRRMVQAGVARSMVSVVIACSRRNQDDRVEEALRVLNALRTPPEELRPLVEDNHDLIESLPAFLQRRRREGCSSTKDAILFSRAVFEVVKPQLLERLKPEFFAAVLHVLRSRPPPQVTKAALQVLLEACPVGTNRTKIAEAGAVPDLVELELTTPDKRTSELVLGVLEHLCWCAEGRAGLVGHAGGIAVVSKRILRVSPAADERAVRILTSVCKYSASKEVVQEMLRVGAVSKLCMVLQANCSTSVKEKARWVLRLHSEAWSNSPCIALYLLTRYP